MQTNVHTCIFVHWVGYRILDAEKYNTGTEALFILHIIIADIKKLYKSSKIVYNIILQIYFED